MAISKVTFAAATCSWIDPATGLPENDKARVTWGSTTRSFLTGNAGYRFCNFMEASVEIDTVKRLIVSPPVFSPASKMYRGPSYGRIASHAFDVKREIFFEPNAVRFTQLTGARTVSPELLGTAGGFFVGMGAGAAVGTWVFPVIGTTIGAIAGTAIGAFSGEVVTRQGVAFPPIWSKIQIRIYKDGRTEGQLLQHSIFPSLTFFRQRGETFERVDTSRTEAFYNATKTDQLPEWQREGWGPLGGNSTPGPTAGNPWGLRKGVTGGTDVLPNSVPSN
jgi:hypothetical protein